MKASEGTYSIVDSISNSNAEQIDASWAILKYQEIGIYRKVACLCVVYKLEFDSIIEELPQDGDGRILDSRTRHLIHEALISVS